jgi:hypothetical protein
MSTNLILNFPITVPDSEYCKDEDHCCRYCDTSFNAYRQCNLGFWPIYVDDNERFCRPDECKNLNSFC